MVGFFLSWPAEKITFRPKLWLYMELICHRVSIPLKTPFVTSFGAQDYRTAMIFEMKHNGITAFSEAVTDKEPFYSYEDNTTAFHIIEAYLAEQIKDAPTPEKFIDRVKFVKGHLMAKAALEMLLWDYHAKEEGIPLYRYIGPTNGKAQVGISIGMAGPDEMKKQTSNAVEMGYKRIKVKIKKGREDEIVKNVRSAIGDFPLSVDANTDFSLEDTEALKVLDKYNLVYMEQPLDHDDVMDHAELARRINTPICLDESIISRDRARKAISSRACTVINIKPGRVSGFTESLAIAKLAREHGIHTWVGGMLETGVGRAFNVALASSSFIDYPGDTSPNEKYFEKDIVKNPFKMENGFITPNEGPGIGVEIDRERLEKVTIDRVRLL